MSRLLLSLIVLLTSGCGSYLLPSPTSRAVSTSDLAGEWHYQPLASGDASVSLTLNADSTFTQTVQVDGETLSQSGTWTIEGSDVVLTDVLVEFRGWEAMLLVWPIIDRKESPTGFAILGGACDPDLWIVLDWVREPPATDQ